MKKLILLILFSYNLFAQDALFSQFLGKNGDESKVIAVNTDSEVIAQERIQAITEKHIASNEKKFQKVISKFPTWTRDDSFLLKNYQWFFLFMAIFISFILDRVLRAIIHSRLIAFLGKKSVDFNEKDQKRIILPAGVFIFTTTLTWFVRHSDFNYELYNFLIKILEVANTLAITFVFISITDITCIFLARKAQLTENKFDDILVPLINKTTKFFVWAFGLIYIGDALSFNMKNILAGMGLGGIAVALAAKDTVSNLFGSFTVLIDRPFSIDDWVVINGTIEGTVEEVGLRSTRIRTSYDSLITVPNGTLTNANIDNYGKRKFRRYTTILTIDYNTPVELLENFCEAIRRLIVSHPHTRKDKFYAYFSNLGASALEIYVSVYWKVPDFPSELNEKHNLLLDIMRIAKKMNINFAYPTQTLHIVKSEDAKYVDERIDYKKAQEIIEELDRERFNSNGHRSSSDVLDFKN